MNVIFQIVAVLINQSKRNTIRRKGFRKTRKMNCQTHHRAAVLIRPTIVITDANDIIGRAIFKNDQIMRTFNSKVPDNSI